eukprot:Rhum_TRINITY_DN14806_c3_g1::Rhum_TRINITY_DN14806_c3_g1_i1::g.120077::m.120077
MAPGKRGACPYFDADVRCIMSLMCAVPGPPARLANIDEPDRDPDGDLLNDPFDDAERSVNERLKLLLGLAVTGLRAPTVCSRENCLSPCGASSAVYDGALPKRRSDGRPYFVCSSCACSRSCDGDTVRSFSGSTALSGRCTTPSYRHGPTRFTTAARRSNRASSSSDTPASGSAAAASATAMAGGGGVCPPRGRDRPTSGVQGGVQGRGRVPGLTPLCAAPGGARRLAVSRAARASSAGAAAAGAGAGAAGAAGTAAAAAAAGFCDGLVLRRAAAFVRFLAGGGEAGGGGGRSVARAPTLLRYCLGMARRSSVSVRGRGFTEDRPTPAPLEAARWCVILLGGWKPRKVCRKERRCVRCVVRKTVCSVCGKTMKYRYCS